MPWSLVYATDAQGKPSAPFGDRDHARLLRAARSASRIRVVSGPLKERGGDELFVAASEAHLLLTSAYEVIGQTTSADGRITGRRRPMYVAGHGVSIYNYSSRRTAVYVSTGYPGRADIHGDHPTQVRWYVEHSTLSRWKLVYEHDHEGKPVTPKKQLKELVRLCHNGHPLRVCATGTIYRHDHDPGAKATCTIEPHYLRAYSWGIVAQGAYAFTDFSNRRMRVKSMAVASISTNGRAQIAAYDREVAAQWYIGV